MLTDSGEMHVLRCDQLLQMSLVGRRTVRTLSAKRDGNACRGLGRGSSEFPASECRRVSTEARIWACTQTGANGGKAAAGRYPLARSLPALGCPPSHQTHLEHQFL